MENETIRYTFPSQKIDIECIYDELLYDSLQWESFEPENRVSLNYVLYRGIFMSLFLGILIFSTSCWSLGDNFKFYLIYYTNWTLVLDTLYSGVI